MQPASPIAIPTIGILGGTFDPPHIGHLMLAECARVQFGLERVLFVPAGDPYRKAGNGVSPARDRIAMVAAAIEGNPRFVLDEREVRRGGPSYTADTLEELAMEGHHRPLLLLGKDALADFPNWRNPDRITELARIAIAHREGAPELDHGYATVDMPQLRVSSSEIRARVAADKSIRYLVPDLVVTYIAEHGLYQARRPDAVE